MEQKYIGRFLILEEIASGAQATVYLSRDTNSWLLVALKVLHPHLARDTAYLERFHREASLTASIDHPNIVHLIEVGQNGSSHFIAMEYLPQSLQSLLTAEAGLSIERAVSIGFQVALGLEAARRKGIVHRDIKPSNILLTDDGVVKVTDFGIALGDGPGLTQVGMVLGTPQYMSPEQCRGLQADPRSDLYSLGVVLYQMLAGELPFNGATVEEVIRQHQDTQPVPVSELRPEISPELAQLVGRCLEKDPDHRFQTPAELANALGRIPLRRPIPSETMIEEASGQVSPTAPAHPPDREGGPRFSRKRLIWAGLATVPLAVLVALVIVLFVRFGTPPVLLETNFDLEPGQTRSFVLRQLDLQAILIAVEWAVTGNGLEVTVELSDSEPPTRLRHEELIQPKAEVRLPLAQEYRNRDIRILVHNATGESTQVALEVTSAAASPGPNSTPATATIPVTPTRLTLPPPVETATPTAPPATIVSTATPVPTQSPLSVVDSYLNALNSGDKEALVAIWGDGATTTFGSPCPEGQFKILNGKLDILADEFQKIANNAQTTFLITGGVNNTVSGNFTYDDDRCKSAGLGRISGAIDLTVEGGKLSSITLVARIDANQYYRQGVQLMSEGKYEEAIVEFDLAISLKPDFAEAYRERGRVNLILDRCQLSVEDFNEAIRIDDNLPDVYKYRREAYICLEPATPK